MMSRGPWFVLMCAALLMGCLEAGETLDASQTVFGGEQGQAREVKTEKKEHKQVLYNGGGGLTQNERLLAGTVVIHSILSDGDGAQGSGFAINSRQVVTNHHVIDNGGRIVLTDANGNELNGRVSQMNEEHDLAIIEGDFSAIPSLVLSKTEPAVGEVIWVAGAPKGFQGTLSTGIISAHRDRSYLGFESYQVTAPISPGSSGGPVMNSEGEIVGVSVASVTDGQSLNFAIPVHLIEELLKP